MQKTITEQLKALDPNVVEQELKELCSQIDATNGRLDRTKHITSETLRLTINL
jgi:anti-sigma regulatory factor (Ser/Thr protein kinase)